MLHSRSRKDSETGKPAITPGDFGRMISTLSNDEVEELKQSLIDYVQTTAKSEEDAKNEEIAINAIFSAAKNKKTLADLSNIMTGGRSPVSAMKRFIDEFNDAVFLATRNASGKDGSRESFDALTRTPAGARRFAKVLSNILNARRTGKTPMDPERAERRKDWLKMVKSLGYSPTQWQKLSPDEQIRLMD